MTSQRALDERPAQKDALLPHAHESQPSVERTLQPGTGWRPPPEAPRPEAAAPIVSTLPPPSPPLSRIPIRIAAIIVLVPAVLFCFAIVIEAIDHSDPGIAAGFLVAGALGTVLLLRLWRRAGHFVGEARLINWRHEGDRMVLSFRMERYDPAGNRLTPVPVEMRARKFAGAPPSDGDLVDVEARWKKGRPLRPKRFHNLTTNCDFSAS